MFRALVTTFLALCIPAPALAATIDFTTVLIGVNGKPLQQPGPACKSGEAPGKDCANVDMTLSDAVVSGLEMVLDSDRTDDPKKKFERDELARKVYNKKADLSAEEISLAKDRVGRVFGAAVVGAAWRLLDAPSAAPK